MIENRELTMDDYLAMLRRRLKVILIPTLLAPIIGFAVSYGFKPKFTSTSLVLVEEQKVPEGYVKPAITEDLGQRVATLQQRALGADRLRPLIDQLQLAKGGRTVDDVMEDIRAQVAIQPIDTAALPSPGGKKKGMSDLPGFNVSYTASTPREAQEVCAGVTDIMLRENLRDRAQVAQSTTEFLTRQVEEAKRALDALDSPNGRLQAEICRPAPRQSRQQLEAADGYELAARRQHPDPEPRPARQGVHRVLAFAATGGVEIVADGHQSAESANSSWRLCSLS